MAIFEGFSSLNGPDSLCLSFPSRGEGSIANPRRVREDPWDRCKREKIPFPVIPVMGIALGSSWVGFGGSTRPGSGSGSCREGRRGEAAGAQPRFPQDFPRICRPRWALITPQKTPQLALGGPAEPFPLQRRFSSSRFPLPSPPITELEERKAGVALGLIAAGGARAGEGGN